MSDIEAVEPRQTGALDILERTLWTLAEGASASGLVFGYQALWGDRYDIPAQLVPPTIVVVGAALAALKGSLAAKFGNGSASTLPEHLEPVLSENVVVQQTASGVAVAGNAPLLDENHQDVPAGTPIGGITVPPPGPGSLPDVDDVPNMDAAMPDGFEDGSDPALRTDPPEGTYPPEHAA